MLIRHLGKREAEKTNSPFLLRLEICMLLTERHLRRFLNRHLLRLELEALKRLEHSPHRVGRNAGHGRGAPNRELSRSISSLPPQFSVA
jgi:hypothetical protein